MCEKGVKKQGFSETLSNRLHEMIIQRKYCDEKLSLMEIHVCIIFNQFINTFF